MPVLPRLLNTNDRAGVSVTDFGAAGDGSDATAAFTAAIAWCASNRRVLYVPRGYYRVTSSVLVESTATVDLTNFAIIGENATSDYAWASYANDHASVIEYNGASPAPIVHIKSRGVRVEGVTLRVAAGKAATAGILWEPADAGPATAGTRVCVSRSHVQGSLGGTGTIATGIEIGTGAVTNMDYLSVEHSAIANCEDECIYVGTTTGQSKAHSFEDVLFDSSPLGISVYQGSFMANRVAFNAISAACVNAASGVFADTIKIDGVQSENCARFLEIGNTSDFCHVLIQNARFAIDEDYMAVDGAWIRNRSAGPTILVNTLWEKVGATDAAIPHIRTDNAGAPSQIISIGNTYLNADPWRHPAGVNHTRVSSLGDAWRATGAPVTYFPSTLELVVTNAGQETVATNSALRFDGSRWAPSLSDVGALAPGSQTLGAGQWHIQYKRLQLTGTQRLTLAGTARYCLTDL